MRKLLSYGAIALMFSAGMTACDNDPVDGMTVNPKELTFEWSGGEQTVDVTLTDNVATWTTTENEEWINVEEGASSFKVVVTETVEARQGEVVVQSSTGQQVVVAVSQTAAATDIAGANMVFDGQGGTQTLTVTSDIACTAAVGPDSEWITVTPVVDTKNTFTVTVAGNLTDEELTGTIVVGNGKGEDKIIEVKQEVVPYVDFVQCDSRYLEMEDPNLSNLLISLWDVPHNPVTGAAGEFHLATMNLVVPKLDLTATRLDFPAGTYEYGVSTAEVTPPCIFNDGSNTWMVYPGHNTNGEIADASYARMVVTGEGDSRVLEFTFVVEEQGFNQPIFKGRMMGDTSFHNPFIVGLPDDLDLGTVDITGHAHCDDTIVGMGYPALWTYQICIGDVTIDENDTPRGTGYYILMGASTLTNNGQPASPAKDGSYEVYAFSIFDKETGIGIGNSDGTTDSGTWIYQIVDDEKVMRAPIKTGTVGISYAAPDHNFVLNVADPDGKKLTGTLKGEMTMIFRSQE
jgi:hypothetical protein